MRKRVIACVLVLLYLAGLWASFGVTVAAEAVSPEAFADDFIEDKPPRWFFPRLYRAAYALKGVKQTNFFNDSLLIYRDGRLIYEWYAKGWDKDTAHFVNSVTKSVVSALTGIAIAEGKIESIDQKVIDFYPDAVIAPGQECKRDITIKNLLTMTSGLPGDSDKDHVKWWEAPDTGKAAFECPQAREVNSEFTYSSGPSMQVLACLVSRAVGENLFEYAKKKLFGPLGMDSVTWETAADGNNYGGFGISMTPRDMLRFGLLYLNGGIWEDERIIPEQWIEEGRPGRNDLTIYGYLFWKPDFLSAEKAYEARGALGQFVSVIPEKDTVIVRTGSAGPVLRGVNKAAGDNFEKWLLPILPLKGIPLEFFRGLL